MQSQRFFLYNENVHKEWRGAPALTSGFELPSPIPFNKVCSINQNMQMIYTLNPSCILCDLSPLKNRDSKRFPTVPPWFCAGLGSGRRGKWNNTSKVPVAVNSLRLSSASALHQLCWIPCWFKLQCIDPCPHLPASAPLSWAWHTKTTPIRNVMVSSKPKNWIDSAVVSTCHLQLLHPWWSYVRQRN